MKILRPHYFRLIFISIFFLLGVGCSNNDGKKSTSQVAAKVGAEEISVHQINHLLNQTGVQNNAMQTTKSEILERLIDQQLAVDQSIESKLNRQPQVVADIEAAKRDVLARAYFRQITSGLPKPTSQEIKKYYQEHPQLFAERRIFNIQEIIISKSFGMLDQLRSFTADGRSMEEVSTWLKGNKIPFESGGGARSAEQIPLEILTKIHLLKDGQSTILEGAQAITFLHITSSQQAPISEATAIPSIERFLSSQRTSETISAKLKELRANTQISYVGEFSKTESPPTTLPRTTDTQTVIEKGVAGLK
nr:EpsD family peptidyl-prolyl cis-trans isomerase [uncultured Albidiferax sp.]